MQYCLLLVYKCTSPLDHFSELCPGPHWGRKIPDSALLDNSQIRPMDSTVGIYSHKASGRGGL